MQPAENQGPGAGTDDSDLFDYALIRDYVLFVLHSLGRHPLLAAFMLLSCIGAAVGVLKTFPKTYKVETTILAQRNQVIASLGNPGRSMPQEADAPTRAASETVLRRDNLIALTKQTDLLDRWTATRAPVQVLRDNVMRLVSGPTNDEALLDALVELLEKRLRVTVGDGTVSIGLEWQDAETAYRLVEQAQQNFLEARHVQEISTIAEAISILEGHASGILEDVNSITELLRSQQPVKPGAKVRAEAPAARVPQKANQQLAQLRVMLDAKRRAVEDLEEFRRRRLAELTAQLTEAKTTYAVQHPNVISIEQRINALMKDSPQIDSLRREEAELNAEYERRGGKATAEGTQPSPVLREAVLPEPRTVIESPTNEMERERLRMAVNKYNQILDRIDSARIELDTSRAAFKYRYSVVRPAQLPKKAEKPNAVVLLAGGVIGGLLLALFACALFDLRRGRVLERWQLERLTGVAILGELKL